MFDLLLQSMMQCVFNAAYLKGDVTFFVTFATGCLLIRLIAQTTFGSNL